MSEKAEKCFLKPEMTSEHVLFYLQAKDVQLTVIEEYVIQEILTQTN